MNRRRYGFTIVELLIVIVVIAILSTIVIVAYSNVVQNSNTTAQKAELKAVMGQLEMLKFNNNGRYPANDTAVNHNDKVTLQYSYDSQTNNFCASVAPVSGNGLGYHADSITKTILDGVCNGHNAPGPVVNGAVVTTFAGSSNGYADGTGTSAQFSYPYSGITVSNSGTIYMSDTVNHRIRMITAAGVVTTLAGGTQGFADGTGSAARFSSPDGIAVDAGETVYVVDNGNHSIRKITPAGVVTTLAGTNSFGYVDATGTAARFFAPRGLGIDQAGNLYVGDANNYKVRKVTPDGVVTTLAGSTSGFANGTGSAAQFNYPYGIAVDSQGNVYVADQVASRIRRITPTGVTTTLAGSGTSGFLDGTGTAAQFAGPVGITVDATGTVLYVADTGNQRIRRVTSAGVVTTFAGSGTSGNTNATGTAATFADPYGIFLTPAGVMYINDTSNHRIRVVR